MNVLRLTVTSRRHRVARHQVHHRTLTGTRQKRELFNILLWVIEVKQRLAQVRNSTACIAERKSSLIHFEAADERNELEALRWSPRQVFVGFDQN